MRAERKLKRYVPVITLILLLGTTLTLIPLLQPAYTERTPIAHSTADGKVTFSACSDTMVVVYPLGPDTVDPAWAYDDISQELIFNVYEPLIFYAFNRSAPPAQAGKLDRFVPRLTTNLTISPDGKTYTFKIREGVKFHNNETLTTEDVEYSFERAMVHDALGSPVWTIYEPLLGCSHANLSDPNWHLKIENAVQRNETHVWFNLVEPYVPFLQILCQSWSSIVNKKFCVEQGDWPANETAGKWFWPGGNWTRYHNPENSPLDTGGDWMCGTGPYKLDYWTRGYFGEYSLVEFDDYWQGWPAPGCYDSVSRATVRFIPYWVKREEMFLNGTADIISVPREYAEELEGQPGIRCVKDLPILQCVALFFTFDINTASSYMGVPGGLPPGTFDENGIPPDFFNETDIRKAFAYSFNWTQYIEEAYYGEAIQPASPIVEGLPYRNPDQEKYYLNLTEAETYFKRAWDGQVWEKGFTMVIAYPVGSVPRFTWIEAFKGNIEGFNTKFHINMKEVDWPTLLRHLVHSELPVFHLGWLADYPDPHSFLYEFMHTEGSFPSFQRYSNTIIDALVEDGLKTLNTSRRREVYYELQRIYRDKCPSVPTVQPLRRHWEREWVQGWYYNPVYPGEYFYHLWKGYLGDTDKDYDVDIDDLYCVLVHYCERRPPEVPWQDWELSCCDFDLDDHIGLEDLYYVLWNYGKAAPT